MNYELAGSSLAFPGSLFIIGLRGLEGLEGFSGWSSAI